jgi:hypothetical protein
VFERKLEETMASIKMIPEVGATGGVTVLYDDIKAGLGLRFVPNLYKVMASRPGYSGLSNAGDGVELVFS